MKRLIILTMVFSASCFAENNQVLSLRMTDTETKDLLGRTKEKRKYISEITLKNCYFNVSFNSQKQFEFKIKDETFTTYDYSVKRMENDNCVLALSNGKLVKS